MKRPRGAARWPAALFAITMVIGLAPGAVAHPDGEAVTDDPSGEHGDDGLHLHDFDIDGPLLGTDDFDVISGGPYSKVTRNLTVAGRGERLATDVTTDVWAHGDYAYTGTFSTLCSDGTNESGIWVWDVENPTSPAKVGVIQSPVGSKANDVKVAAMTSGDVLVLSNESCDGGPGGVEIYDVDDPTSPVHLAHVAVPDGNAGYRAALGLEDSGIHNIFLWTRDGVDYMGLSAEYRFGNFKIYDITDPTAPVALSSWGPEDAEFAEELAAFGLSSFSEGSAGFWLGDGLGLLLAGESYILSGFGASANRVMHDLFISDDGTKAYVNFWDAGLVLLDITDPTQPAYVSTAIDPSSTDGEVNSHSVWTTDDGRIVVEGEEDFAPYETRLVTSAGDFPAAVGNINPNGDVAGEAIYVGLACGPLAPATAEGQVALIQRGACAFTTKGQNASTAGYDGMVVFNTEAGGDALVTMGGGPVDIPGVFIGHADGLTIAGAASAADLVEGPTGTTVSGIDQFWNGWSGLRIWDYSDPADPVLASTFDTACSALEPGSEGAEDCIEGGTYSSHNLIIEGDIAYVSWYYDGVLMIDISDPYDPVEVGRYHERGDAFEAQNAGPQDVWGVYKIEGEPWVYASDRNGGLYVLKAYGQGSAKKGKQRG